MKKLFLLIFLLPLHSVKAQDGGFLIGGGYTISSYDHLEGLNQFVKNYNSTRPWLTNKMGDFGTMQGVAIDISVYLEHFQMKLEWTGNNQTQTASGVDNSGKNGFRQVKIENNVVNFGFGYGTMGKRIGFFMGTTCNIGFAPQYTRAWNEGDKEPDFGKIPLGDNADISLGISPEILFKITKGVYLDLKPYYELNFEDYSFVELESDVNHQYQYNFDETPFKCRPNHFGLDLKIMFGQVPNKFD